ncbi:MAG: ATP-binding protein [Chloroflexota bacterium]
MEPTSSPASPRPPVAVNRHQCLRVRHRAAACQACALACPRAALDLAPGPEIGASCDGCGCCVAACPTGALALAQPDVAELLATPPALPLACRRTAGARGGLPCLGFLDAGLLLALAARLGDLALDAGPCAACPGAEGLAQAEQATATANAVLAALGGEARVSFVRAGTYAGEPGLSRRELLGFWRRPAPPTPPRVPEPSGAVARGQASRGWLRPPRRALLLQAIGELAGDRTAGTTAAGLPFWEVALGAECDGCGMCLTFCPTGALRAERQGGTAALVFAPEWCLGCDLCAAVCPRWALTVAPATRLPTPGEARPLRVVPLARCSRCGAAYPLFGHDPLCPDCRQKARLQEAVRGALFGGSNREKRMDHRDTEDTETGERTEQG